MPPVHESTSQNQKMRSIVSILALLSLAYSKTILHDTFTPESFKEWVTSDWKGAENMGKWDLSSGEWYGGEYFSCYMLKVDVNNA